jgi:sulfite exporter TauE/SafE
MTVKRVLAIIAAIALLIVGVYVSFNLDRFVQL